MQSCQGQFVAQSQPCLGSIFWISTDRGGTRVNQTKRRLKSFVFSIRPEFLIGFSRRFFLSSLFVANCVLVCGQFFAPSNSSAQQTYTIDGNKVELTFAGLDGTKISFAHANGKHIKVPITRLSPDELRKLLKEIIGLVMTVDAFNVDRLESEDERTWRSNGRTIRGKFKGADLGQVHLNDGSLGLSGTSINIADLQRSDLLYVIRHLAPFAAGAKPADVAPKEKDAIDHEKRDAGGEKIAELTEIDSRVLLSAPNNHSFSDVMIDEKNSRFLTAGSRKAIWWSLEDGSQISTKEFSPGVQIWNASPSGKYLVQRFYANKPTGSKPRLTVWETSTQKKIFAPDYPVPGLVFSPDENLIAYQTYAHGRDIEPEKDNQRKLYLFNLQSGKTLDLGSYDVFRSFTWFCFSPDSQMIASYSEGKYRVWLTKTGEQKVAITAKNTSKVAFDQDGRLLLVSTVFDHRVFEIDSGDLISHLKTPGIRGMTFTVFDPTGTYVGGQDFTGKCFLWDRELNRMHSWQAHEKTIGQIEFTPDGKTLITTGSGRNAIKLWDLETKAKVGEFSSIGNSSFRMTKDGKRLICFDLQNLVICDIDELKREYRINRENIARSTRKGVEAKEGINKQWVSVLACFPEGAGSISIFRPRDFLAGKDLEKHIKEEGLDSIAAGIGRIINKLNGYTYSIPSTQEQELVGTIGTLNGTVGEYISFVKSNKPIDADQLFKEIENDQRIKLLERAFRGRRYVVSDDRKIAVFMPDARTVFFAGSEKTIEKIVLQLEKPPTDFAKHINNELNDNQFLAIAEKQTARTYADFLFTGEASLAALEEEKVFAMMELMDEKDAVETIVLKGNVSDNPKISLAFEFKDKKISAQVFPFVQTLVPVWRQTWNEDDVEFHERLLSVMLNNCNIKNEGTKVLVELDQTKVSNLIETLLGPPNEK